MVWGLASARPRCEVSDVLTDVVELLRDLLEQRDRLLSRPAEHVEPWLPRLRARLGPRANDEELLLAAFYDDERLAPLRDPVPECRFRTTPMYELVRYLAERRDIERARIRFAGTEINFAA